MQPLEYCTEVFFFVIWKSLEKSQKDKREKKEKRGICYLQPPSLPLSLCMCIWGSDLSSIQSAQCATSEECTAVLTLMKTLFSTGENRGESE